MAIRNKPSFHVPPLVPHNTAWGQSSWMRWKTLDYLVKREGWTRGAELGVWQGRTFGYLLQNNPALHMVAVDLWQVQEHNHGPENYAGWDHDKHEREARQIAARHPGRARIIKDYTFNAAEEVEDGSLDFVFIDADHSYEGCTEDISRWGPKVRPGGYITGHDINWPTVKMAVELHFDDRYEIGPNVVWIARKADWNGNDS